MIGFIFEFDIRVAGLFGGQYELPLSQKMYIIMIKIQRGQMGINLFN